jgi:hypothetical protein
MICAMPARPPSQVRRWLATLAASLAVGTSVLAGYPEPPNVTQSFFLSMAMILTLLTGVKAAAAVDQKKSSEQNYIGVVRVLESLESRGFLTIAFGHKLFFCPGNTSGSMPS